MNHSPDALASALTLALVLLFLWIGWGIAMCLISGIVRTIKKAWRD